MKNYKIDFIEFQALDMDKMKDFYSSVFGWSFVDYGENYADIKDAGIAGGFARVEKMETSGTLVVLYHDDLEKALLEVKSAGAEIVVDIFSFPGGRRFEFLDPSGNKLAIWSHE